MSKQAYHNGTVLIQCPSCKNRHLIADHLKIFSDERITLEDILATKGETVTKKTVDASQLGEALENEDLEWEEVPKELSGKIGGNDS
jgi:mitochondrial protein import protein ZIM17